MQGCAWGQLLERLPVCLPEACPESERGGQGGSVVEREAFPCLGQVSGSCKNGMLFQINLAPLKVTTSQVLEFGGFDQENKGTQDLFKK
ncbi:hypothetical protein WISP_143478 [Willisornis vidua]|uniref:Uncharacterized protein n=1 Tax=Willisornis vidua TaxID=1566151 RepID=A0ABQ9CME1_9PASS|nr:hypothetical protein WISP_143478 [Willisornis vidua]